jgi:hypothetical protein
MKTMETMEAVSSDGMEKRVKRHKSQRSAPCAREKPGTDWKMTLQIVGAGRRSRKRPTLVVGKKPYGKSQIMGWCNCFEKFPVHQAAQDNFAAETRRFQGRGNFCIFIWRQFFRLFSQK